MDDATVQRALARPYSLSCRLLPLHNVRLPFLPKYPDFAQQHCYRDFSFIISGVRMDTCFIFGVPAVLLEGGSIDRRSEMASEIGEQILRALESTGDDPALSVVGESPATVVQLLCDPDVDEIATYVWSAGKLQELDAISDKDLRETLDSVDREIVSRWKRCNPGYQWEAFDG